MVERQHPRRRETILAAAAKVFDARGYAATTVEAVADAAGISKGSIYNYFESKRDLFAQVFAESMAGEREAVEGLLAEKIPVREKLSRLVEFWYGRLGRYKGIGALILEFWAVAAREHRGELGAVFQEMYARWRGLLGAMIEQGINSGEFPPGASAPRAASLIMAVLDGITVQSIMDVGIVVDRDFVEALKRSILNALRRAG